MQKRQADAGVGPAVQSVVKHQNFKRMFIFGLRNLYELCKPPTIKWKENALSALDLGVLPALAGGIVKYQDDADVLDIGAVILFGITAGIRTDDEAKISVWNACSEAADAIIAILSHSTSREALEGGMQALNNLDHLKSPINANDYVPGVLKMFHASIPPSPHMADLIINALILVSKGPDGVEILSKALAAESLIGYCSNVGQTPQAVQPAVVATIANAMTVIESCTNKNTGAETMERIITILEQYKSFKTVQDRGSVCLAAMIGKDKVKTCIQDIKAPDGSPEKDDALILLSSLSYISSYAGVLAKNKGIPMLVDAINDGCKAGAKISSPATKGVIGSCKMLGKIGAMSEFMKELNKVKAMETMLSVQTSLSHDVECLTAACDGISPFLRTEKLAIDYEKAGGFATVLKLITEKKTNANFISSALHVFSSACHQSVTSQMKSDEIYRVILDDVIANHVANPTVMTEVFRILGMTAENLSTVDLMVKNPNFMKLMIPINGDNLTDLNMGSAAAYFFFAISQVGNAQKGFSASDEPVPSILRLLVAFSETKSIRKMCLKSLECLATEEDVKNVLNKLQSNLMNAKNNPSAAFQSLAGCNGLSYIDRLTSIFHEKKAVNTIINGMKKWIEMAKFDDQYELLKMAASSLHRLIPTDTNNLDTHFAEVMAMTIIPQLKGLIDKQDQTKDHSLTHVLALGNAIAEQKRFSADQIQSHIDIVLKAMSRYPDYRAPNQHCIDILDHMRSIENGPDVLIQSGAMKQVVATMGRIQMYEKIQVSGFRFLDNLLKINPEYADAMRRAGGVNVCKAAHRIHGRKAEVKRFLYPVHQALLPVDELEAEIINMIKELNENVAKFKSAAAGKKEPFIQGILLAAQNLAPLTTSEFGAKIAARNGVSPVLDECSNLFLNNKKEMGDNFLAGMKEINQCYCNVANNRIGVTSLAQNNAFKNLMAMWDELHSNGDSEDRNAALAANMIAQKRMMRFDNASNELLYKKGGMPKVAISLGDFGDDNCMVAAAGLIAGFKNKKAFQDKEFLKCLDRIAKDLEDPNMPSDRKAGLVEAAIEFCGNPNALAAIVSHGKMAPALFKALDQDPEHKKLFREAVDCLNCLRMKNLRPQMRANEKLSLIPSSIAVAAAALKSNKDQDPTTLAKLIQIINDLATKDDADDLKAAGLLPLLQELLEIHDHEPLQKACGELMAKIGADGLIAKLIEDLCIATEKPLSMERARAVNRQSEQLQQLLNTEIEKPKSTLKQVPQLIENFAKVIDAKSEDSAPALAALVQVVRRIAEKGITRDETAKRKNVDKVPDCINLKKLLPQIVPAMGNALGAMVQGKRVPNKKFIVETFECLAMMSKRSTTNKQTLELLAPTNAVETAKAMLAKFPEDPEICHAALQFLAALGETPKIGYPLLKDSDLNSIVNESVLCMKRNRNFKGMTCAAIHAIAATIDPKGKPPKALTPKVLAEMETIAADSPEGLAAMCGLQSRIANIYPADDKVAVMRRQMQNWKRMQVAALPLAEKIILAEALAVLARKMGPQVCEQAGVLDMILENMEDPELVSVMPVNLQLLTDMANDNPEVAIRLARDGVKPAMTPLAVQACIDDPMILTNYLKSIMPGEGNARTVCATEGFKQMMVQMEAMAEDDDFDDGLMDMMVADLDSIKRMIEEDKPEILSLELVNNKWMELCGGEVLDNGFIMRYLDYQVNQTHDYSRDRIESGGSPLGKEMIFGCLNYNILLKPEVIKDNIGQLIERQMPQTMINALHKHQSIPEVTNAIAKTGCVSTTDNDAGARAWANANSDAKNIISTCLRNGIKQCKEEEDLMNRMELLRNTALTRFFYNDTEAWKGLVDIWDRYDAGEYTPLMIAKTLQTIRRIVNDHWRKDIMDKKIPERLDEFVVGWPEKERCDIRAMPDVLFCVGSLCVIPEIRTILNDLGAVEHILDLIRRLETHKRIKEGIDAAPADYVEPKYLFDKDDHFQACYSPTVTNACLSIAQLTMGIGSAIATFVKNKGVEQMVTTMKLAVGDKGVAVKNDKNVDYDIANGVGVVMANTCFKRDDMKEAFGKAGAPDSIMAVINVYDGSAVHNKIRAMLSMLKAVSNQGLVPSNMKMFVEGKIDQVLYDFFAKSQDMPDELLECALQTTSNLTMENDDVTTAALGKVLKPLIQVVLDNGNTSRATPKMLALCFEVLAFLSRQPSVADDLVKIDGPKAILKVATQGDDPLMQEKAIYALAVVAQEEKHHPKLREAKIFHFLTQVILDQSNAEIISEATCKNALRCIRRCLLEKKSIAAFCDTGGMNALIALTSRGEDASKMTHMDAHRVLIACLANNPPPPSKADTKAGGKDDWDFDVADEGTLASCAYVRRPASPRSWESCKLDPSLVSAFIQAVCALLMTMADDLGNLRMLKCALGLIAYFACEKIEGTVDAFYSAEICDVLNNILTGKLGDPEVTKIACYIINNVAYASGPDSYYQLRRDSRDMRKALKEACEKMGKKQNTEIRAFCEKTYELLNVKSMDPDIWRDHMQWDFDWSITGWDLDKYPNGVQDLPVDMKAQIREGDKVRVLIRDDTGEKKSTFWWSASTDMLNLKWRIDKLDGYKNKGELISQFGKISKDMQHSEFYSPSVAAGKKVSSGSQLVLQTTRPTDDAPNGYNFTLSFNTKGQRDSFYEMLTEWREAAAYGL